MSPQQTTGVKTNRTSFLCGNGNEHHNTELKTLRQIMVQIVQNEPHCLKPGTNSRDTDNIGSKSRTKTTSRDTDNIGNKQAQRQTQHRNLKKMSNTDPTKKKPKNPLKNREWSMFCKYIVSRGLRVTKIYMYQAAMNRRTDIDHGHKKTCRK